MKDNAYIFPDGTICKCLSHKKLVKDFLQELMRTDSHYYPKLIRILDNYYTQNEYVNYDDFATFTLGWIKITKGVKKYAVFAGYDFQFSIILNKISSCTLMEIPNTYNLPILIILDINYKKNFNSHY